MNIIGITGFAQSGKDTAGEYLVKTAGATHYALADPIREVMSHIDFRLNGSITVAMLLDAHNGDWDAVENHRIHGPELRRNIALLRQKLHLDQFNTERTEDWIRDELLTLDPFLDGDTAISTLLDYSEEDWDVAKADRFHGPELRRLMQKLGTEVVRDGYGAEAWIDHLQRRIEQGALPAIVVVTDIRFDNEAEWVLRLGGTVIRIDRPGVGPVNAHASDAGISDHLVTATIENSGSKLDLFHRMDSTLQQPIAA